MRVLNMVATCAACTFIAACQGGGGGTSLTSIDRGFETDAEQQAEWEAEQARQQAELEADLARRQAEEDRIWEQTIDDFEDAVAAVQEAIDSPILEINPIGTRDLFHARAGAPTDFAGGSLTIKGPTIDTGTGATTNFEGGSLTIISATPGGAGTFRINLDNGSNYVAVLRDISVLNDTPPSVIRTTASEYTQGDGTRITVAEAVHDWRRSFSTIYEEAENSVVWNQYLRGQLDSAGTGGAAVSNLPGGTFTYQGNVGFRRFELTTGRSDSPLEPGRVNLQINFDQANGEFAATSANFAASADIKVDPQSGQLSSTDGRITNGADIRDATLNGSLAGDGAPEAFGIINSDITEPSALIGAFTAKR